MKAYKFNENPNWLIKTNDYTAVDGDNIIISTGTSITISLPAMPGNATVINIAKNNIGSVNVSGNGKKINKFYIQVTLSNVFKITLIYYSSLGYWVLNNSLISKAVLKFTNLYCNSYSSYGINDIGMAWGWGQNNLGQLGTGNFMSYSWPVSVLGGISFTQLNNNIVGNFTIGIRGSDGTGWGWGYGDYGQLGTNTITSYSSPVSVIGGISFKQISTGDYFSLGIRGSDGTGWAWGWNIYGNLGNGNSTSYSSPISIVGGISWAQLAAGSGHSLGIRGSDGTAWAWGQNDTGQLGTGNMTSYSSPISVLGGISWKQLSAGIYATLGIRGSDGTAWAWGYNNEGQLGQSNTTSYSSPKSVLGGISFTQITYIQYYSAGVGGSDGTAWSWGSNTAGCLGDGTITNRSSPVSVVGTISFTKISTSCTYHTMGVRGSDGTGWSWGYNAYGELGNRTMTSYSSPVLIG